MNHRASALAFAALCIIAPSLHALESIGNPVIVTATRTAQTTDETLAAVTVLTRADIEHRQARSLDDLLRDEAGVSVANTGGAGKVTSLFVRGTEAGHVLVLIDGVKIGSPTLGVVAFENIPLDQIERIEIVRGPRSSVYGSEAIGGVIQIFTRRGGGPWTPAVSVGGGSHRTIDGAIGVAGGGDTLRVNAFTSGIGTQGINACRGVAGVAGCFTDEPDKDGFHQWSQSLRGGYRFSADADADLHWLRTEGRTEFDGSFVNQAKFVQEVYGAQYRFAPASAWHATVSAGHSRDDSDNFKDGVFLTRFNTDRGLTSLQNDFTVGANQLVSVGADYQDDRVQSTTAFPVVSRSDTGVYSLYQTSFGSQNAELSLRQDRNEQFGTHATGGAAWAYRLRPDLRVRAAYGTAFKAPTFNELYFPGFGNPNLRPETSRSAEVGANGGSTWRWGVNFFRTDVDDLIGFDAVSPAPVNVDRARIRGLENILALRAGDWSVDGALTLLDPRNASNNANNGKLLPHRARESLRLGATRASGPYRYGALLRAEGARFDDQANTQRLAAYATVDLLGEYTIAKRWLAQARVANLFDKSYETAQFFNQPGREFFVTLRYQP